jgi:hypothetical protein
MEGVRAFIDSPVANSENFRASADPDSADGAIICVSGCYYFKLSVADNACTLSAGEGCAPTSAAIKKILRDANARCVKDRAVNDMSRAALVALRDAYLAHVDELDEEAQAAAQADDDAAGGGGAGGDDDDTEAEMERAAEATRLEVERRRREALAAMSPAERQAKEMVDAYIARMQQRGGAADPAADGLPHAAALRLMSDFARVCSLDSPTRGWRCEMDQGSMRRWNVMLTSFDKGTDIDNDMTKWAAREGCEKAMVLQMTMDRDFPNRPPFVRLLRPQLVQYTGHVTLGGAVCMLPLTDEGWNPSFDLIAIVEMVRANILSPESKAKVNFDARGDYQLSEAQDAFRRLVATHGWKHEFRF